jgi:cation:H+ antiporter
MYFASILPTTNIIWLAVILLVIGIVLIVKGGDFFVDASVWVAEVLKMPKFLIGATIVSIATTLPEMIVSIIAVSGGNFAISIGNAVGSVTANTGLILAISAIFVGGVIERRDFGIKAILIMAATIIIFIFGLSGTFGILPSILLLVILIYYMYETAVSAKRSVSTVEEKEVVEEKVDAKKIIINILKFILGAAGIVLGADLLVENAKLLASAIGVSDGIIAITIVAIGTSLPELITTITSITKKQGDLGVGNIIGANIIDLVLILPICSFISNGQLIIEPQSMFLDIPASLVISLVAVVPTLIFKKFTKAQGFVMLALYIAYIVLAATIQF